MKKLIFSLLALPFIMSSCENEVDAIINVQLHPTFLTLDDGTDKPMKAPSSVDASIDSVVYAIQIFENEQPFYYGLFNDVNQMQIALKTEATYKFFIAAYKVGTGIGLKNTVEANVTNYFLPNKIPLLNKFVQGDVLKGINSANAIQLIGIAKDYQEVDAFFATKTITIAKGTSTIDFSLLRMGFGLDVKADALTYGSMEVYLGNDTLNLNTNKLSTFTTRQFFRVKSDFELIHDKADSYTDTITISAKWTSTNGVSNRVSGQFEFKRNYKKSINVSINSTTNKLTFEGWDEINDSTVTDIDGNVYKIVKIGTQIWMAENLKVTHYNDGTLIPNYTTMANWGALTAGARCSHSNNTANVNTYGYLYNWYAATDLRRIAPEGWRVPTDSDWTVLSEYLGGESVAGGKLKATGYTYWNSPNTGATNSTGFNALGGGYYHTSVSNFVSIREYGRWWSSTNRTSIDAYDRNLNYFYKKLFRDETGARKNDALSIRCIKE